MARIRTIKPEFWLDEDLCELSAENHLFAAALLNHWDDEGYFKANPKLLHAQIFALRDLSGTVPVFIQKLEKIGFLRLFDGSDGKKYGQVINFNKHQSINKPKPSKIKDIEEEFIAYGTDTVPVPVGKEQGTGNREQDIKDLSSKLDDDAREIFDHWLTVMKKKKSAYSEDRKKKIKARLSEGYTVDEIKLAITNCSNTPHNMGQNENNKTYNDIELICRSPTKLEQFRDNPGITTQNTEVQSGSQNQPGYQHRSATKLSTVEQATIHNAGYAASLQQQIEAGAPVGYD